MAAQGAIKGNPVFSAMFISIIGFGFLGGISGVMMGTEQLNLIIHNTIYVPGHFHATVVIGTTLAFMALTYFLLPVLFRREMMARAWPSGSPTCSACRCTSSASCDDGRGHAGRPRRHWDMALQRAALGYEWPGAAYLMMGLWGIAGIAAITGASCTSTSRSARCCGASTLDAGAVARASPPIPRTAPSAALRHRVVGFVAPGGFVLAMVFLAAFACTTSSTGSTCRRSGACPGAGMAPRGVTP